ncbi:late cornified envelope protein 3C-like [Macrotis lagotis]|uniref:late cornified envelope protein 3C-like n=1 Tax=Macrotis lagotis TaxID=92651 RepID=UPI003D6966E7
MSCQQNKQQCQTPPKCQTPKCPPKVLPQAPYLPPVSSGCGASSGGCSSSGSEGGCCLFSHLHRSDGCRSRNSGSCGSGIGHLLQSNNFGGSSGGCGGGSGGCC